MITFVFFRNKQYLNKCNKEYDPRALRTWEQFIKQWPRKMLREAEGQTPIVIFVLNSRGRELLVIRH